MPLAGAFGQAVEDITGRLEPIDDVLARLPFGPAATGSTPASAVLPQR